MHTGNEYICVRMECLAQYEWGISCTEVIEVVVIF